MNTKMKKIVLTFGLISAALSTAMALATFPLVEAIGFEKTDLIGYTTMVASGLLVYFGVRSYREDEGTGPLSFGRAFGVGVLITLVSCACFVVTFEIIYFKLVPEFGDKFAACMVDRARAAGGGPQEIDVVTKQAQTFKRLYDHPVTNAALTFATSFPIGLIASVVSAAILRKR
jgi:hypothetical protein